MRQVFQSPLFERQKKRLQNTEIEKLDEVVRIIQANPKQSEAKKGDLTGIYVNKFKIRKKNFLLAYEFNDSEILLLCLGPHENFYRDLKLYLK